MAKSRLGSSIGLGAVAVGGTVNTCPSSDTSTFCQISRVFQIISWIFSIIVFLVVIYWFGSIFFSSRSKGKWYK